MASPSNKSSSSPILSRMGPAPVVRNSETSDPVRRSFAGNPFVKPSIAANSRGLNPKTPANSPLDYQRRSSTGIGGFDEKENGKDHNPKPARVRSPTIPNGGKNFMSPTISASSKIAMSPKKKILVEKNEPVRTSLSISDLKSSSINLVNPHEAIQPTSLDQKPTDLNNDFSSADASFDLTDHRPAFQASSSIHKLSKTVTFTDCVTKHSASLSNATFVNADSVNLADRFKLSPASSYPSPKSCPTLAPLDADPSMPPYDSKTNYLSPRPQFLLYRPNPRIERYLHKEEDGKRFEGSYLFDCFSDTEVSEETQSESFKNSDEVSSDEFVEKVKQEKDEEEEEEKNGLSEPSDLVGKDIRDENSDAKGSCKPVNLYKLTALILLLCFGCSSLLYTTPLVKNNYPSELYQFAKLSYPELAKNLWVLSRNVVAYAHGVIMNFGEEHVLIHPVQYFNLTALREDISVDGYFVFDQSHGRIDGFLSEPMREIAVESESLEEEDELQQKNFELDEEAEEEYSEMMEDPEPSFEEQEHQESELHEGLEELPGEKGDPVSEVVEMNNNLEVKDEKLPLKPIRVEEAEEESFELPVEELSGENDVVEMNHNSEIKDEKLPLKPMGVGEAEEESPELDVKLNDDASESFESSAMASLSNVNPPSSEAKIKEVISVILLLPLMAAGVYFYSRRVKTISSNAKVSKAKDLNSSKDDNLIHIPLPRNYQTEGDMVEESCPSELSSFQKSSSYGKKGARGAGSNKAQSQEMKLRKNCRRESVSSSLDYSISTDSPSYGSFTAYKKFSTKHSNSEEEVVTPVRRSSRIKTMLNVSDD